ncbi:hypothetical protein CCR91_04670 [Thiorhodovibrio winogradskyi]|nr:hypothetical protein [Thiorhodovibrio winogradskyi]
MSRACAIIARSLPEGGQKPRHPRYIGNLGMEAQGDRADGLGDGDCRSHCFRFSRALFVPATQPIHYIRQPSIRD